MHFATLSCAFFGAALAAPGRPVPALAPGPALAPDASVRVSNLVFYKPTGTQKSPENIKLRLQVGSVATDCHVMTLRQDIDKPLEVPCFKRDQLHDESIFRLLVSGYEQGAYKTMEINYHDMKKRVWKRATTSFPAYKCVELGVAKECKQSSAHETAELRIADARPNPRSLPVIAGSHPTEDFTAAPAPKIFKRIPEGVKVAISQFSYSIIAENEMTKIKFDLTLDSILLNCQQVSRLVGTQSAKFKCSDTNPREAGLHSVEIKLLHIAGQKSLDMYYKNRRQGFEADASMGIPQCDCRSDPTYNIMNCRQRAPFHAHLQVTGHRHRRAVPSTSAAASAHQAPQTSGLKKMLRISGFNFHMSEQHKIMLVGLQLRVGDVSTECYTDKVHKEIGDRPLVYEPCMNKDFGIRVVDLAGSRRLAISHVSKTAKLNNVSVLNFPEVECQHTARGSIYCKQSSKEKVAEFNKIFRQN